MEEENYIFKSGDWKVYDNYIGRDIYVVAAGCNKVSSGRYKATKERIQECIWDSSFCEAKEGIILGQKEFPKFIDGFGDFRKCFDFTIKYWELKELC